MATEIHQVGSETPPSSEKDRIDEKNTAISSDIEGNLDEESKRLVADRAEATELTPVEAFKWNVEGDQSPCTLTGASSWDSQDTDLFTQSQKSQHVCPTRMIRTSPATVNALSSSPSVFLSANLLTFSQAFRAWFLTTVFVVVFAGANQFFGLRYPSLSIGYVVAQLLVFPIGRAWEILPRWRLPLGPLSFDINPGRFSIKEHALIVICVNISASTAYASGALVSIISPVYWDRDYGAGFSFIFLLTTQMLGFGLAGLSRRWLVYPAALIWPSTLSSAVLFRALHEPQDNSPANGWTISRYRFFSYFTIFAFVLFWFPDYIWTSLSTFAFVTWIAPHNQKVNTIFGMNSGLGLLPISFDWTQINYAGSPLITPFYITCNAFAVVVLFYLFLSPILYYSNVWQSAYLPLLSSSTFDNTGSSYNITRVVDDNLNFVLSKYEEYSPMYISMSYSLTYALSFAAVTAIVVHTYLYNGAEIWAKFKNSRHGGEDIHKRLMNNYKEVPDWWYGVLTVVIVALGCLTVSYWDTGLPVWGFIVVCFGMGVVLIVPEGILEGTTNQRV